MPTTLYLLVQPLEWDKSPRDIVGSSNQICDVFWRYLNPYLVMGSNLYCKQTYMCFHRMHETTSTIIEARTPMVADKMMATSMATTVPWGYCAQWPHTGRQSEVFASALQEKPSWHCSVLQLFPENVKDTKDHHYDTDVQCSSYKQLQPQKCCTTA